MSLDLFSQSIANSGLAIIRNVKSYDLKLQEVPSLLSGFMESYGSISGTFIPKHMSFNVDWERCVANKSQASFYPHCAAVQAFVVDMSVIGSIAIFTLLVALTGFCCISRVVVPLMHGISEEHINEDDEVILELDISSIDRSVAKPKRHESYESTVPCIILLSIFMTCGLGALGIALYAQIVSISDSESVWYNMAVSSDSFQMTNIRTISRLNQSLFNSTKLLDSVLLESKSSIESRWWDAEVTAASRMQKVISWKQLSHNVTKLTESFFASLPRAGTCEPCRNEELLVASIDFEVGTLIPNISIASPALKFWNSSDVTWSFNMLQTAFANETFMLGKLSSFIKDSHVVHSNVAKSIFALWSLEVACILLNCILTVKAIWMLYKIPLAKIKKNSDSDDDHEAFFEQVIKVSRFMKWFALLGALLSSVQWIGVAFSFSIGRYLNEICAGMDQGSPVYWNVQSYIFGPTTASYLASCASAYENYKNKVMFDAPLSPIINQLNAYNLSSEYDFSGVVNQIDKRIMQAQIATMARSTITLETALDSFSNYGKQITSYLSLVNQLSGIKCFWGNITLCKTCQRCNSLQEESDFQSKHADLIRVEQSILGINDAILRDAAGSAEFVQAAKLDLSASQTVRLAVVNQVQKTSDAVRSVAAFLRSEWECLGFNNALPLHRNFKLLMCDINSKSAASTFHISWVTFAIDALIFQWISTIFLYLAGHLILSSPHFGSWSGKGSSKKGAGVLNDIHLSEAERMQPSRLSVSDTGIEIGQIVRRSERFFPLSAPARGSVTSS